MEELARWESFYVIVGAAAAVLIGLQFVVITLIAERPPEAMAGAAFGSPTIVHFSTALLLSAALRAPWRAIVPAAVLWGLVGLAGVVYSVVVARRMRAQSYYKPVFEDWFFHLLLPAAAYATLAISPFASTTHTHAALFAVGTATLLLLFIGIHNAWDSVAYHVLVARVSARPEGEDRPGGEAAGDRAKESR